MKSYVSQISSYTSIVDGGSKQKHIHLVTENFSRAYDATQKECDIALKLSLDFDKWKIWTFRTDCILQTASSEYANACTTRGWAWSLFCDRAGLWPRFGYFSFNVKLDQKVGLNMGF
jgi:hypothetical protein